MRTKRPDLGQQNYSFAIVAYSDMDPAKIATCLAIIAAGNAVSPKSAALELPLAQKLVVATHRSEIVGVGVIKRVRPEYASKIAKRSRVALRSDTSELGYVAVAAAHRGRHLSTRIVGALIDQYRASLFATTDSTPMKSALKAAGFIQAGEPWKGKRALLSLWVRP